MYFNLTLCSHYTHNIFTIHILSNPSTNYMSASPESDQASHTLRLRERLKAIQQNRLQAAKSHSSTDPGTTQPPDDNLMLQTYSSVKCSEAGIESTGVSEKELRYFQELVAKLQTENSELKRGLGEKDRELKKSQEALQAIGAGGGSGNVAGRIVELSKKTRELQAELYAEQSVAKRLEGNQISLQELVRLREEESSQLREQLENKPPSPRDISPSGQKRLELAREEATDLKARLGESKNANQSLRQELRLTQKALEQELGPEAEKYSLSQIINSEAAWKGRAQQIKLLKKKVSELRVQIQQELQNSCSQLDPERDLSTATRYESQNSLATPDTARVGGKQCSVSSQSDRQRELLRRMDASRKDTAEKTQNDLEEMKLLQTELKNKYTAVHARNQTLSQETKQLRKELAESKAREKAAAKPAEPPASMVVKYQTTINGLKQELHKKCVHLENLTQELANRNNHVTLPSILPACEEEVGGKSRGRQAVLRGQLTGSELLDTTGINGMLQSVSVERDKLRELVGLIQERLQEAVEAGSSHEAQLRQLRHSNVLLEKEVSRVGQSGAKLAATLAGDINSQSRDVILQRIEISEDENAALQHRLSSVSQSRKEDTRVYKEMLDASRQIFTDTLNQLKYVGMDQGPAT